MTDLKDKATTDKLAKRAQVWRVPVMTHAVDIHLRPDVARVRVPGSPGRPPHEYAVDEVQVRSEWKWGQAFGITRVTLKVRLVLGNGALCYRRGTLFLYQLQGRPGWLVDILDRALPPVEGDFEIS